MKRTFFFTIITAIVSLLFSNCSIKKASKTSSADKLSISNVVRVARITGKTLPKENLPNPNNSDQQFDVLGTDLGLMWAMTDKKVGIFFGDTNGEGFVPFNKAGGGNGGNWRSNVLAFSEDRNLEDGLTISSWAIDSEGKAREVVAGGKANPTIYQTSIPTGAIRANGKDYVHYMNIYDWNGPKGRWLTNFSSIYASADDGKSWERKENLTFKSDSKFSQVCYAKKDGYVYMIGTLSGRGSNAHLARFLEKDIEKLEAYEYWNGKENKWMVNNEAAASEIISGPVGEASLMYHQKYKRWILMYIYDFTHDKNPVVSDYAIVYRTAQQINGKWSDPKVLITGKEYPGLYSPYMHPLKNTGDEIYFNMSLWGQYNVFLMKATIKLEKSE